MLKAQLHGKLSPELWVNSEDLLTSAVLGTLANFPGAVAARVLGRAVLLGGQPTASLSPPLQWSFWPAWRHSEPDVVVEDSVSVWVIEAKLSADFGADFGHVSQLQREWLDGIQYARECNKRLVLVALTHHAATPRAAIARQFVDLPIDTRAVAWLGWGDIAREIQMIDDPALEGWRDDLLALLDHMGLAPFRGFSSVYAAARVDLQSMPWGSPRFRAGWTPCAGFAPSLAAAGALSASWLPGVAGAGTTDR